MAEENRRQFALEELAPVFQAQERLGHSCVLTGGQSVIHWAKRLPVWLAQLSRYRRAVQASETHQKMLAILARHAESLCIRSEFRVPRSALP